MKRFKPHLPPFEPSVTTSSSYTSSACPSVSSQEDHQNTHIKASTSPHSTMRVKIADLPVPSVEAAPPPAAPQANPQPSFEHPQALPVRAKSTTLPWEEIRGCDAFITGAPNSLELPTPLPPLFVPSCPVPSLSSAAPQSPVMMRTPSTPTMTAGASLTLLRSRR